MCVVVRESAPVCVSNKGLHWRLRSPEVPKLDPAVVTSSNNEPWLVGVVVHASHSGSMGSLNGQRFPA